MNINKKIIAATLACFVLVATAYGDDDDDGSNFMVQCQNEMFRHSGSLTANASSPASISFGKGACQATAAFTSNQTCEGNCTLVTPNPDGGKDNKKFFKCTWAYGTLGTSLNCAPW